MGLLASCTTMDEYKKISGEKEIIYTGKIEQVEVLPGDGRLQITGICQSDPKIVKCRIYWDLRTDSIDVPVDMSNGPFIVAQEIALPEKSYNFDIFTYDADGNRSIPVNIVGKSYGDKYRSTISNRLVKTFEEQDNDAVIEWMEINLSMYAIETEVVYTNKSDQQVKVTVPLKDMKTTLTDYKPQTEVKYTTLYNPDGKSLDIFRSTTNTISN